MSERGSLDQRLLPINHPGQSLAAEEIVERVGVSVTQCQSAAARGRRPQRRQCLVQQRLVGASERRHAPRNGFDLALEPFGGRTRYAEEIQSRRPPVDRVDRGDRRGEGGKVGRERGEVGLWRRHVGCVDGFEQEEGCPEETCVALRSEDAGNRHGRAGEVAQYFALPEDVVGLEDPARRLDPEHCGRDRRWVNSTRQVTFDRPSVSGTTATTRAFSNAGSVRSHDSTSAGSGTRVASSRSDPRPGSGTMSP